MVTSVYCSVTKAPRGTAPPWLLYHLHGTSPQLAAKLNHTLPLDGFKLHLSLHTCENAWCKTQAFSCSSLYAIPVHKVGYEELMLI